MADSTNLLLPYIAASQAQKHVTHNDALRLLDGIVQLSVLDRDLTAPPGSPVDGVRYLVAAGATGAWAGWDGSIAMRSDGMWYRLLPRPGWFCWVQDEALALVWTGSAWTPWQDAVGLLARSDLVDVTVSGLGFGTGLGVLQQALTGLSGATRDSSVKIPNGSVVFCVTARVRDAISGATSFNCGTSSEPTKFGSAIGITAGTVNFGAIAPTAFYSETAVRLTAVGGNFSAGAVQIGIHYMRFTAPSP